MTLKLEDTDVLCGRAIQYYEGDDVAKDFGEALRLFTLAAERGHAIGQLGHASRPCR